MKKAFKIILPIFLALAILLCLAWYLFIYDLEFTRDMLLFGARKFEKHDNRTAAAWFYDSAYRLANNDDAVAIELAEQYKASGNYTRAEYTLSKAIEDGGGADLYVALSQTYVEQDKLLDAVKLLNGVRNETLKAQLDALRPAAPVATPDPGFYSQYISVTITADSGTLYVNPNGEYPSIKDAPCTGPIPLRDGENAIYALTVSDNGLVSPVSIFGYTIGGVVEEVHFADAAVEKHIRTLLNVSDDEVIFTNQLWTITDFTVPEDANSFEDLAYLTFLETLTITAGPSDQFSVLSSMANLTTLQISNVTVSSDELAVIGALPKLEHLTLSSCNLSTTAGLERSVKITTLDLSNNTIRNIDALQAMTALTEVNLQHNALTDLTALSAASSLQKLDISYNAVDSLNPICNNKSITWLDASNNSLTDLSSINQLTHLHYLSVAHNSITDISAVASCSALTELDISSNQLTEIAALSSNELLNKLNFSYNQVTELPNFPKDCALVTIDGSHNLLTTLEPLSGLSHLNNVFMDYNEELDSVEPLANCPILIKVNVYGTKVTEVSSLTEQSIIVNYDPTQE